VDVDFNVDVLTGHDGVLRGASGGHSDTGGRRKALGYNHPLHAQRCSLH
jgi:citrate lyase alpha subunit